jgi:transcriptional regulator with XRE-family HTH domain
MPAKKRTVSFNDDRKRGHVSPNASPVLAEKIRQLRIEMDLSQREMGEKLGVPQNQVSKWEICERPLAVDDVMLYARVCAVPVEYLADDVVPVGDVAPTERVNGTTGAVAARGLCQEQSDTAPERSLSANESPVVRDCEEEYLLLLARETGIRNTIARLLSYESSGE